MAEYRPTRKWTYLLGGALVGAVCGVLFAKKPGEETREDVIDWLKEKRERTKEYAEKFRENNPFKKNTHENHHKKELIRA